MRLLIAEKPSIFKIFKEAGLITPDTETVFTFGFGLWRFTQPKLSFADIPFTNTPSRLRPFNFNFSRYLIEASGESVFSLGMGSTPQEREALLDSLVIYLRERIQDYEEIICAVDNDRTGFGAAHQLIEQINPGMAVPIPVHCLYLYSLERNVIRATWEGRASNKWTGTSRAQLLADTQQAKKTFDYWWNANSSLVLSELCHWVDVKADPLITKYELMLLGMLADSPPLSESKLLGSMERWKGTGKYHGTGVHGAIGSATSRADIIASAIARGMIAVDAGDRHEQEIIRASKLYTPDVEPTIDSLLHSLGCHIVAGETTWWEVVDFLFTNGHFNEATLAQCYASPNPLTYRLTPAGKAFMSRLHPRTYDPDLPFRLEQWITAGDYASMRRYINTVFGRQLRYQRNQLKCSITQPVLSAVQRQLGYRCLVQKSDETNCIDRISLVRANDVQHVGQIEISACSGGQYRVLLDCSEGKNEYLVHAAGDEELGELSIQDFINVIRTLTKTR